VNVSSVLLVFTRPQTPYPVLRLVLSPLLMKMGTDGLLTSVPDFRVSPSLLISCFRSSDQERGREA